MQCLQRISAGGVNVEVSGTIPPAGRAGRRRGGGPRGPTGFA